MTVGIYEPGGFTASSYYRSFGPLHAIKDLRIVELPRAMSVNTMYTVDVFFAARPYEPSDANLINLAKEIGLPVWVDFDDDIWNVPHTNPARQAYDGKIEAINRCCKLADIVTVSTPALADMVKRQLRGAAKHVEVIRNAVRAPLEIVSPAIAGDYTGKTRIGWRGTSTHSRDLEQWRPLFHRLNETKKFKIIFMGVTPAWSIDYDYHYFTDFFSFQYIFRKAALDFLLYPLEDCIFNRSKSNIAWLEATAVGAATFASLAAEEWDFPGIGHHPEKLITAKSKDMEKMRNDLVAKSVDTINKHFLLDDANKVRQDILSSLV